jgi:hypothetical protein
MGVACGTLGVRIVVSVDEHGVLLRASAVVAGASTEPRPLLVPATGRSPMSNAPKLSDASDVDIDLSVADVVDPRGAQRVLDVAIAKGMQVQVEDGRYVDLPLPKDIRVVWGGDYGYSINLDERGDFKADVRDAFGHSVYEIDGFDIFEDGFMKDKQDLKGLTTMLVENGVIPPDSDVLRLAEAERRWDGLVDDERERNRTAGPSAG